MLPEKRPKIEMAEEDNSPRTDKLLAELQLMQSELEQVDVKRSLGSRNETVTYRPTYRAILAKKGYLVKQTLGSGSYSKVKFAHCFGHDRDKVAVKIIDRSKAPKDFQHRFLPREMEIWPKLRHPHIVRMLDMFEDNRRVYMILEYAENGDVLRYIQRNGAIKDIIARSWTRQIGEAVRYLHEQNVTHRDLKLENLLLDNNHTVKICDFGFVKEDCSRDLSRTYCGSKSYAAPEILKGEPYDPRKADIWAIGVILYIFVTGKMPFDESKGNAGVLEEHKRLNFPWQKFRKNVTDECRELIMWLFSYNYADRPDIYEFLSSPWFKKDVKIRPENVKMEGNSRKMEKHDSEQSSSDNSKN